MKKNARTLILFLTSLFISASIFAQKPLPVDCPGLKEQLLQIQKSFAEFDSLKKDNIQNILHVKNMYSLKQAKIFYQSYL